MAKHKATVVVSKREGFNGWWAAGRHWPGDQQHEVDLEDHEIANLAGRPGIVVLVGGKVAKAVQDAPSTTGIQVTPDEMAALERFRAEAKEKEATVQTAQPGYTLESKGSEDAPKGGGNPMVQSAAAPLENRDILQGGQPPPGPSTTTGRAPEGQHKKR